MYDKIFKTDKFEFNIDDIINIAKTAGEEVLKIYNQKFKVEYKDDRSPLTQADKKSHSVILSGLKKINKHIPVLSEEGKSIPYKERKNWVYFWMTDPLDGTKEFIKKNGEFTINIALIYKNTPVFGIVYAPVLQWLYFNDGKHAYKKEKNKLTKLPVKNNSDFFTIAASRSHLNKETEKFIENHIKNISKQPKDIKSIFIGSSLKLCFVAEGKADIYPRLAPTMEWDTAAADAVVKKSGKNVYAVNPENLTPDFNKPLIYNKENLLNPWFVVE
jgi:3'(2'), 5'-bisphosphate nucleotidase